jgi:hypothetical protein
VSADDAVRDAIQARVLDAEGDGWTLTQYVVCMGLQRITADGRVESTAWYWSPPGQPDWQSLGLIEVGRDMLIVPPIPVDEDDE